ncbi:MAG: hypothetical protein HY290_20315 [Planctomycetia bacterium]|nr:hypothetical protein [Planctomycetia bacterium]
MSSVKSGNPQVDQARETLCQEIARCMRDNKFSVRIRIAETEGTPAEASFYSHGPDGWQKESQPITDRLLVNAIRETLEMLESNEHHDWWSVRHQSHSDGTDTELRFQSEKLTGRLGVQLESLLMGALFRDQHDSRKDSRRNIRTPRPKSARK